MDDRGRCQRLRGQWSSDPVSRNRGHFPENWAQRYLLEGGSGFDGKFKSGLVRDNASKVTGLHPAITELGVARASSNGSNRADAEDEASPGVWLSGTPEGAASLCDYAGQGLGTTIHFSKALVETAYGQPATHGYFAGCSNGGRNAYVIAERWPDEFSGIFAGCEGMAMGSQVVQWIALANTIGTDAALSKEHYSAAHEAAVAACVGNAHSSRSWSGCGYDYFNHLQVIYSFEVIRVSCIQG